MKSPRWQLSPFFLLRRDLPANDSLKYDTLEICLAAEKVSGTETILGAQEIRGLWRVYPLTRTARNKLLIDNLTLREKTVQVYDNNPFIVRGGSGEEVPVTKVWISDILISVDGKDIETALVRLGSVLRSSLINEKIRNKDGKLTRFLTSRRFVFVNIPERPLERTVKIGGFIARLYHKEQPRADPQRTTCSTCLERGHLVSACPNSIRCGECRQEGHRRGDPVCDAVSVWGPQGSVGQRGDTQVSNAMEPATPNPQVASTGEPPTPDPQVANAREPPSQHETSDNEASSGDEDQWEDLLPAIDDTPSKQPSQKATARQLSVTKKTKVSGKKQARDSKKKTELVNRGRQLARVHGKQSWTLSGARLMPPREQRLAVKKGSPDGFHPLRQNIPITNRSR